MSKTILNIAGGKLKPIEFKEGNFNYNTMKFLLNLDRMYEKYENGIKDIIRTHKYIQESTVGYGRLTEFFSSINIYDFLRDYPNQFDGIVMYRFLEHVPKAQLLYFIYSLSTTVKIGGIIDVIVPDYRKLAIRILEENVNAINFEAEDIITTFELLNETYDPHASIWTEDRVHYFWELEGRFKINCLKNNYEFDGRDIYLRFLAQRVK